MSTSYHMVHYRKFEVTSGSVDGQVLEGLARAALGQKDGSGPALWERAQDRLFPLGDSFGGQILLNRVADLQSAVFGELCFVEAKGLQALLQMTASKQKLSDLTTAEVFDLEERHAPTGSRFIRGLGYWLAIKDHLFFVKVQSLTPDHIHSYLNWLLKRGGGVVDQSLAFNLQAEFDKSVEDVGEIRKLRLTGRRIPAAVSVAVDQGAKREVATRRRVKEAELQSEQARPIWEAVLGPAKTQSFVNSLGPGEYITADTALAVRGRRTAESRQKLKELANDLADVSDAKVQVEGSDGRVSDGDAILRTRMPFESPQEGSSLFEFDNVADQLMTVYSRFVQDGKIKA